MKKPKALVLFSGGLDSILAVRILQEQGIDVEAVHFVNPFSSEKNPVDEYAKTFGFRLHKIKLGKDYINLIKNPKHGYGSHMNPCMDCRIYMLKKAKALAKKIGADFIATGEVVGERSMSQQRDQLMLIEKEAELENKIVRPLSAKNLPPTEAEKRGLIKRENLFGIRGKRRTPQMKLAEKYGIEKYPTPSGGCLLTDENFARKLRDLFDHKKRIALQDIEFLKLGRHFRYRNTKFIVGRNQEENEKLLKLAKKTGLGWMEVKGYPGPVTVIDGKSDGDILKKAAALTVFYSDAPENKEINVVYIKGKRKKELKTRALNREKVEEMRI